MVDALKKKKRLLRGNATSLVEKNGMRYLERTLFPLRYKGACRGMPGNWWHPSPDADTTSTSEQAIAICSVCPVRVECLQHALDNHEKMGIWGGIKERRRETDRRAGMTAAEIIAKRG